MAAISILCGILDEELIVKAHAPVDGCGEERDVGALELSMTS